MFECLKPGETELVAEDINFVSASISNSVFSLKAKRLYDYIINYILYEFPDIHTHTHMQPVQGEGVQNEYSL